MGWERKRGKLAEFNALLRGEGTDRFCVVAGRTTILPGVRFVITLDTDTQLPRDAARELVGTMAHPLNRPRFDPTLGRVVEGYGILQPRVGVSLPRPAGRGLRGFSRPNRALIPIPVPSRTCIRTSSGKARTSARGSTTSMHSSRHSAVAAREPHPQPRPARGSHARAGLVSDVVPARGAPFRYIADVTGRASLDPRRLADRRVGAVARSRPGRRVAGQPALGAFAMEDPRQPPSQPRTCAH